MGRKIMSHRARKIKVLECIRQGQIGGGESHLLSLVENLDRERFDPVVLSFTSGPMIDRLQQLGVASRVIHTEKPFDWSKWKLVKKFLADEQVDIVHAHGTRANSNILWAARSLHIPVIYTIHGWSFHPDQNPLIKGIRIWGEKYLTEKSTVNISVSESNQQSGKNFIRSFDSIVINNGIDQAKFNPNKKYKDIRAELGIDKNEILILFVARFSIQKQPLALIEAYAKALSSHPTMHLLMIGDGDQKSSAVELAGKLGINNKISFQSFRLDVPDILASADIFVLPSLWEGLPIGLLEAMAMGKAVIASDVDGSREIIQQGENGWLIKTDNLINDLASALTQLAKDNEKRKRFSEMAIATVNEKYNAASMTRKIENIYIEVLQNR